MTTGIPMLTLVQPAAYEIRVPGELDENWKAWDARMTVTVEGGGDCPRVTTLTGTVDQAALQGILRRLYSLGLPLISVICVNPGEADAPDAPDAKQQIEADSPNILS